MEICNAIRKSFTKMSFFWLSIGYFITIKHILNKSINLQLIIPCNVGQKPPRLRIN